MFLPYVCFFWLLQVSVFLSVGGVVTFFFCTCVYLFGVVILHTCIRLFDIIILCTGVCLCDTILCVLEGASTDSRADGCGCSVMPLCVTLITFLLCATKKSLQKTKTTFKPWHLLLPLP